MSERQQKFAGLSTVAATYFLQTRENGRSHSEPLLTGTATWNPSSIADGGFESKDITVTGAALGDFVVGVSVGVDVADLTLTAAVTATDTVTATLMNQTGGAVDLASSTVRALVLPKASVGL